MEITVNRQVLTDALIPELPQHYRGKVRDCYDLEDNIRVIITTDRLSAYDRPICSIPEKGRVLTKAADYWFRHTAQICPNHVLDNPDPNVLICKKLDMIPVEIVVRDYLAGTTDTSLLQMYHKGLRYLYGYTLPDQLRDHELLPFTMITPTTKSATHDAPLNAWDVIDLGLCTVEEWTQLCRISLDLFAFGRQTVARRGLILVDTKYEFGCDEHGKLVLADEIHTPDSSRYWFMDSYPAAFAAGDAPRSFDKDVIRHWIAEKCDPYKDPIPEIPEHVIQQTSQVYIDAYERITGLTYVPFHGDRPIMERIRAVLVGIGII